MARCPRAGKLQSAARQEDPSIAVQCGGLRALSALESEPRSCRNSVSQRHVESDLERALTRRPRGSAGLLEGHRGLSAARCEHGPALGKTRGDAGSPARARQARDGLRFRSDLDAWRDRASHLAPTPMPAERRRTPWRLAACGGRRSSRRRDRHRCGQAHRAPRHRIKSGRADAPPARAVSERPHDGCRQPLRDRAARRAIALDPASARAHAELASAYVTRLAYVTPDETRELEEKAFAAAEKALSLDPDVPEAYLARGDLLWTHSQRFAHERAVQEFRRALALNPQSDQAHRRLARVFVHVGFFDEARQHADHALTINPSNAQALNSRAQAILWIGKDEEALAILRSIPGPVLPELVEANTVFALHRLGRRDEARSHLLRAVDKYRADPSGNLRRDRGGVARRSRPAASRGVDRGRAAKKDCESVASRRVLRGRGHGTYATGAGSRALAPGGVRNRFPCYALFEIDPISTPSARIPPSSPSWRRRRKRPSH